jgi:hypothetical protein
MNITEIIIREQKKKEIADKMYKLKAPERRKFASFLATDFSDDDLKELTDDNYNKMIKFLADL